MWNIKLLLFINDRTSVTLGFVCDICQILLEYNLHAIINNLLSSSLHVPTKREWKTLVKRALSLSETALWNQRLAIDSDFTFFRTLHLAITPFIVYQVCNRASDRRTMSFITRWTRPVILENRLCHHCNCVHQEELVHALCECPSTLSIRTHFQRMISDILLPDEKHAVLNLDSVALTLKLLGAPIEPIFDASKDKLFMRTAFSYIVGCANEFVSWHLTVICIACVHVCTFTINILKWIFCVTTCIMWCAYLFTDCS